MSSNFGLYLGHCDNYVVETLNNVTFFVERLLILFTVMQFVWLDSYSRNYFLGNSSNLISVFWSLLGSLEFVLYMCCLGVSQWFGQSLYTETEVLPSFLSRIASSFSSSVRFPKLIFSDCSGPKDWVFFWSFNCLTWSSLRLKAIIDWNYNLGYSLLTHFESPP